jgi:hypothetical protein
MKAVLASIPVSWREAGRHQICLQGRLTPACQKGLEKDRRLLPQDSSFWDPSSITHYYCSFEALCPSTVL